MFEEVFVGEDGLIGGDADLSGRCGEGETDLSVVGRLAEHQAECGPTLRVGIPDAERRATKIDGFSCGRRSCSSRAAQ